MSDDPKQHIEVQVTDSTEFHCFRVIFWAALEPGAQRHKIEIMLHATQLVDLLHKGSQALGEWQCQTTDYLLKRLGVER